MEKQLIQYILRPQRVSMDFYRLSRLVILTFNKKITATIEPEQFIDRLANDSRRLVLK